MPPYKDGRRPNTKQPTGLTVTVPLCKWCRISVGFPCKVCGLTTCYNCLRAMNPEGTECVHQVYRPAESNGWGEDCPNPMCDAECNVCMGKGVIWTQPRASLKP